MGADMARITGPRDTGAQRLILSSYILASFILCLTLPSVAQTSNATVADRHARFVLVSIPDRRLAVLEGGEVTATFPAAVGARQVRVPRANFKSSAASPIQPTTTRAR